MGQDFLPNWYISLYTLGLVLITFLKPPQFLAILNFVAVYFVFNSVGRMIVPETMVPILGIFIISRLINNKKSKDFEMYPLFLWIGSFAIFSSSFYYLIYTLFTLLTVFLHENAARKLSLKGVFHNIYAHKKQLSMSILITILLFIFFPRFYNFLPTTNINTQGKIGYSKSIDNSQTSNLLLSSQTAFYAELSVKLSPELLYWRGRVHTKTDGYNWSRVTMAPKKQDIGIGSNKIIQTIKYEQDFGGDIILLNTPLKIIDTNLNIYRIPITNEYRSYITKKKSVVKAESSLRITTKSSLKKANKVQYLQLPGFIPLEVKNFAKQVTGETTKQIINSFKRKLLKDQFVYTLSPGLMPTISDFIKKKLGYCTHYSSLLGLVLRMKGIPTRLVSGFQGGQYNSVGKFYEIKSNDAHVWVEYFNNGSWTQADPTSFISPERIRLGGQQFLNPANLTQGEEATGVFKAFNRARQYFDNLNYKISLFLDNYDRTKQNELSKLFKVSLKTFFLIGLLLIVVMFSIYYFVLKKKLKVKLHPADSLLIRLDKKLKNEGIFFYGDKTIRQMKEKAQKSSYRSELLNLIELYQEYRYRSIDHSSEMEEKIKNLKKDN